jgi:hypothetical protein
MKLIFLDVDGVLVNRESLMKASGLEATAHPDCVSALNWIIETTGADIVISSTWRIIGMGKIKDKLNEWGVAGKVRGITPDHTRRDSNTGFYVASSERGDEIQEWLDKYRSERGPIDSFVIIDDDADMKHLMPFLVQAQLERGLTMEEADRAVEILGQPPDEGREE